MEICNESSSPWDHNLVMMNLKSKSASISSIILAARSYLHKLLLKHIKSTTTIKYLLFLSRSFSLGFYLCVSIIFFHIVFWVWEIKNFCRSERKKRAWFDNGGPWLGYHQLCIDFVVFSAKFWRSTFIVVFGFLEMKEKKMTSSLLLMAYIQIWSLDLLVNFSLICHYHSLKQLFGFQDKVGVLDHWCRKRTMVLNVFGNQKN